VTSRSYALFSVCIPLVAALLLPILSVCGGDRRRPLECVAKRYWAVMLCVYCVSCMPALLMLDMPGFAGKNILLLLFFLLVAQAAATGEHLGGRLARRHAAARTGSYRHTLEKGVGGSMGAVAAGCALCWLTPFTPLVAGAIALVMALMGFFGAAVMSAIRRDAAFKKRGQPVVGRADVMDRLASLCFSAPALLQLTHYFYAA
jgi:phosphatidate cytidylyltransferase